MNTKQPIKNCYWVLEKKFLAGEYPWEYDENYSTKKISALLEAGITCFIDLTHPDDHRIPYHKLVKRLSENQAQTCRFPIFDYSVPESKELTVKILDQIDTVISKNGVIYLHCWGGIGRTGTIVGCWLSRHGYKGEKALHQLNNLWQKCPKSAYHDSPESKEQEDYIVKWYEGV